jgi:HAD superfamily hydrolase (TIGR01509 family)
MASGPCAGHDSVVGAHAAALDPLALQWRSAFRAARDALSTHEGLPEDERRRRLHDLSLEIDATQALLRDIAPEMPPLLISPVEARRLLRLPPDVRACIFTLDGVLIPSAALHLAAWRATFDAFLLARAERTGAPYIAFNPLLDYPRHIHARPRLEGVREFLSSRGIRLAEGRVTDAPGKETVHGLANRKSELLLRQLTENGVHAFDGSHTYLELAREAGLRCAVVSASANTTPILELSGLASLVDERVDGDTIAREHLAPKPAPDTLLAACGKLGVEPSHVAAFETTAAGVVAARAVGFELVVGVDGSIGADPRERLKREGADVVVGAIAELLAA